MSQLLVRNEENLIKSTNSGLSSTIAGLTEEAILNAARSMEEIYFQKGEHIIVQDDIGDSFFVLEEGTVVVTVSIMLKK